MRPALLLALLAACGGGAPVLGELYCRDGDDACQSRTNPGQLALVLHYDDAEGDVSGGVGRFYVDGKAQQAFAMRPVFLESGVDLAATSGTLALKVSLDLPDPVAGTVFDLAFEVVDRAGNVSNRPRITFRVDRP